MSIKEDVQAAQQIVGALQYDKVSVVQVRFPTSDKLYFYKTTDTSIYTGDYVVIDSPYSGLVVLQVEAVASPKEFEISNQLLGSCKWVVQKVRGTEYLQLKVNEEPEGIIYLGNEFTSSGRNNDKEKYVVTDSTKVPKDFQRFDTSLFVDYRAAIGELESKLREKEDTIKELNAIIEKQKESIIKLANSTEEE